MECRHRIQRGSAWGSLRRYPRRGVGLVPGSRRRRPCDRGGPSLNPIIEPHHRFPSQVQDINPITKSPIRSRNHQPAKSHSRQVVKSPSHQRNKSHTQAVNPEISAPRRTWERKRHHHHHSKAWKRKRRHLHSKTWKRKRRQGKPCNLPFAVRVSHTEGGRNFPCFRETHTAVTYRGKQKPPLRPCGATSSHTVAGDLPCVREMRNRPATSSHTAASQNLPCISEMRS